MFTRFFLAIALIFGAQQAFSQGPSMLLLGAGKKKSAAADPFALDGTPRAATGTAATIVTTGLTTTFGNVVAFIDVVTNGGPVLTVADTALLTWTKRAGYTNGNGSTSELWSTKSSSALSNDVVTITTTSSSFYSYSLFAYSGAKFSAPYDVNAAIPNVAQNVTPIFATACTWTTTNANDILVGVAITTGTVTAGTGFTLINGANFEGSQYKSVTATQSAVSIAVATGALAGSICDAIVQGP